MPEVPSQLHDSAKRQVNFVPSEWLCSTLAGFDWRSMTVAMPCVKVKVVTNG